MAEAVQETETATELEQPRWSVVSFEKCERGNLTYADAASLLANLDENGVTGLCIVTDETAARLSV